MTGEVIIILCAALNLLPNLWPAIIQDAVNKAESDGGQ
jgi:hypothetical protein